MIKKDVPCKDPFTTYLTQLELNFTGSETYSLETWDQASCAVQC